MRHADPIDYDSYDPPGDPARRTLPPITKAMRANLLVSSWVKRKLPPRDFLLGDLLCTTSRWLIFGETGVGKTLVSLEMAGAIAAGQSFLKWEGRRPARVIYLDGEMPIETFKERMELVAKRYGEDIALYGYNRDDLGDEEMPPLNTEAGQAWLLREIEAIKPDIIFFDSIMCLLGGNMSEEDSWAPVKMLARQITGRRIAQVWLHHTGHDATKGYGTKTREWEMDTVLSLSKVDRDDDDSAIRTEFKKNRLRTPANAAQFAPLTIKRGEDDWSVEAATRTATGKEKGEVATIRGEFVKTYDRLADAVTASPGGFNGAKVKKISVDAIRDELRSRGLLETNDNGAIMPTSRTNLRRAKTALIAAGTMIENEGMIWKP
ncbi:AAA family ATPase [uncultured Rhodoblastus sp.]|uniref:AAA family ATPase n=1 Tax=uncultured Rhodoblastus sp. TaxID=543037 RepID=UPI0025D9984D|nr:AAA family ATPase [uncultured Rhodoblastus sp.]